MEYISSSLILSITTTNRIYIMVAMLLLSAFFSMSETVYSSVKMTKLESMKKEQIRGAKTAYKVANNYDHTLTTLLVGNNIVNIGMATLAIGVFKDFLTGSEYLKFADAISTVAMTIIVLICGEILPKTYGKANAEKLALVISPIVDLISKLLYPISIPFLGLKNTIIRKAELEITVTESEFDTIIDTMSEEGVIQDDEREMLQSVLDLNDMHVSDIMTPRVEMYAIDVDASIETVKEKFFTLQYSRMPVYKETPDNIVGILYEREFFASLLKNEGKTITELLREAVFVPHSMKVDTLIEILQQQKQHMAIVLDEYGGTNGVVTMEDALEVLVGEIYDEYDTSESQYILEVKENRYHINAAVSLEDFFSELKLGPVPDETTSTSLAGFLLELNDQMPTQGDHIYYMAKNDETHEALRLNFNIKKIKDRRIRFVQLDIEDPSDVEKNEQNNKRLFKKLELFKKKQLALREKK